MWLSMMTPIISLHSVMCSQNTGQVEAKKDVTGVSTVDEQYPRNRIESSKELAQDLRDASGPSADPSTDERMIIKKPFLRKGERRTV